MFSIHDVRRMRDAILACARDHGVTRVYIFGSLARGEEKGGSDVDLLVRYAPERSLIDHIAFGEALHHLLNVPVDVVSEAGLSPFLGEKVLDEAVDL